MKKSTICVLTEKFSYGGLEKYIEDFIEEAQKRGYKAVLITGNVSNTNKLEKKLSIKTYKLDISENPDTSDFIKTIHDISEIIEKENCSILLIHPFNSILYGYLASIKSNIPYIIILHGPLSLTLSIPPDTTYKLILKKALRSAFKIYCVSEDIILLLKQTFPELKNISLFPNALPQKYFNELPWGLDGDILLVHTFQKVKLKGVEEFFKLFKTLPATLKRHVHIFGDGEELEKFKSWLLKEGLFNWVTFHGFKEEYEKEINTTVAYGVAMARSAIELMAKNIPVFLIGLDGPKGFITRENFHEHFFSNFSGLYSPNIDKNKFVDQLRDLFQDPSKYRLKDLIRSSLNYDSFFKVFEKDLEKSKKVFSGYPDEERASLTTFLISYFNLKSLRDLNFHYNLLYFSQSNSETGLVLYKLINELTFYKNLSESLREEKEALLIKLSNQEQELKNFEEKLKIYEIEIKNLNSKINSLSAEKELYRKKLNEIYMSKFWKVASLYYKLKRKIINFPRSILLSYAVRELSRIYKDSKREGKKLFIYPPTVDWNIPLFQRPQHMFLELSKLGNLAFYFTPNYKDKVKSFKKLSDTLIISPYFKEFIHEIERFEDDWIIIPSTNNEISIWDIRKLKAKGLKIIYDYIDEFHPDISPEMHISYKTFIELKKEDVDIITCVSRKLYEEMIKRFPEEKILYLPNGVDYHHFKVERDLDKVNDFMKSIIYQGKPIIGYYGALANWIDYELLRCTAFRKPEWNFVLIGVDYDGSFKEYINKFPQNVFYIGHIPYDILPWYAIWFDVAIIPFKKGEIAKATSPIKMYEYMALNKPVVATEDLIECYGYEGVLISKNDCGDFIEKLEHALLLTDNEEIIKKLDETARKNTWTSRVKTLLEYIRRYEKKSPNSYRNKT